MTQRWHRHLSILFALALVAAACGDDGGSGPLIPGSSTTTQGTTTTAPATTTTVAATTTLPPTTTAPPTTTTTVPPTTTSPPVADAYTEYVLIRDDTGMLEVSVPVEWSDVQGVSWLFGEDLVGPSLSAAPDYQAWLDGWSTPGVFMAASGELDITLEELLDGLDFDPECIYEGREPYDDGEYVGLFDSWYDCGGIGTEFALIAASPIGGDEIVLVEVIVVTDRDYEALEEVVATFRLLGAL